MEGVLTCAVAIFAYAFLIKFPDEEKTKPSWRFLSPEQTDFLIARLNAERGDVEPEKFTWKRFLQPATEWYIYGFPIILLCVLIMTGWPCPSVALSSSFPFFTLSFPFLLLYPSFLALTHQTHHRRLEPLTDRTHNSLVTTIAYAFAFTLPIILRTNLGFSMAMSQCLGAPPYAFSGVVMYLAAWYGDRRKTRGPVLIALCGISLVGLPIMAFVSNPWGQYVGVFVTVAGTNSAIPAVMAYQANNIRGQWRRAFCSASLTGIGGIGGIAGALIFRTDDAPGYIPGFATCMA
jgi:hypothetical protein